MTPDEIQTMMDDAAHQALTYHTKDTRPVPDRENTTPTPRQQRAAVLRYAASTARSAATQLAQNNDPMAQEIAGQWRDLANAYADRANHLEAIVARRKPRIPRDKPSHNRKP